MLTPYTTTLTDEAANRGIPVTMINGDPDWPIFDLHLPGGPLRCFNALTDLVGAATYHLVNNKRSCHVWLADRGIPVPAQIAWSDRSPAEAEAFLSRYAPIVVKPCMQWGGRGVSMGIRTVEQLRRAVRFARRYESDVILEETVAGEDLRVILVGGRCVAAIRRNPAHVTGDGLHTLRQLIRSRNRKRRREDPSNLIPENAETWHNLAELGRSPDDIPAAGEKVRVRLTNNYHTGGDVDIVTDPLPAAVTIAERIVKELALPLAGVDFLIDPESRHPVVIEVSPDMAISPPEGEMVAHAWIDYLTKRVER